ncbi:MAG: hypothetical protein ACRDOP_14820 [Gaiellaceae bacterium]
MAFHPPVHREFVLALRVLDAVGLPYAEAWRLLRPVAARLGIPRPSYASVRRIVIAERERKRRRADELDRVLADLLAGRFPYVLVEHKLVGLGPTEAPRSPSQRRATSRMAPRRRATMRVFGT